MKNTIRFDLSNWLIHFFRPIDFEANNAIDYIEHMGWNNINEGTKYTPLFMLRCALRQGRLWATWSYRNNVRTIYGNNPAVCFTEMPIAAFLESGKKREENGEAMSQFSLIFPKNEMFAVGANPVIYGLTNRDYWLPSGQNKVPRMIDPNILPEMEQYRYVAYNPTLKRPIDWTHEREWRWPYINQTSYIESELQECEMSEGSESIPGFDFYEHSINGMGVLVKTSEQATWVVHDILSLVDRGEIGTSQFSFVLASDDLQPIPTLVNPNIMSQIISNSLINLEPFFSHDTDKLIRHSRSFSEIVMKIEDESEDPESGEFGGCWLWILDNTSVLTRALLHCDRVVVSKSGKYLVNLFEFSDSRSLRQREEMTKKLVKYVESRYQIECGYFSVLNSDNPNDLPFYCSYHADNHMYYNVSCE